MPPPLARVFMTFALLSELALFTNELRVRFASGVPFCLLLPRAMQYLLILTLHFTTINADTFNGLPKKVIKRSHCIIVWLSFENQVNRLAHCPTDCCVGILLANFRSLSLQTNNHGERLSSRHCHLIYLCSLCL